MHIINENIFVFDLAGRKPLEAKSVYSVTIGGRKVLSVTKTRNRPRLRTSKSMPPAIGTRHSHQGVFSSRTS